MFLTNEKPVSAFDYIRDHGISCDKLAIEAELSYLPDFEQNAVSVDMVGSFIVLDGVCRSSQDAERIVRIAREIVGSDRLISQIAVVSAGAPRTRTA